MYVCMYVCMHMYIHIYIYIYICMCDVYIHLISYYIVGEWRQKTRPHPEENRARGSPKEKRKKNIYIYVCMYRSVYRLVCFINETR